MKPILKNAFLKTRRLLPLMMAVASLAATAHAAAPGITGPTFNLTAAPAYLTQPDGQSIYSWGYGCTGTPAGMHRRASRQPSATPCRFRDRR